MGTGLKMNWYMRRKSSRPFLMNWIKLSPRCLATKLSFDYLFSYYVLSIYIYHQLFLYPGHCSDLQASFSSFHFLHLKFTTNFVVYHIDMITNNSNYKTI